MSLPTTRMNSIERRLQVGLGLALVILFGLLWFWGNHAIRGLTEEFVASRLEHDAESLLAALALDRGRPRIRRHRVSEVYSQPFSGHYYLVRLDTGEEIASRSLWDQTLQIDSPAAGGTRRSTISGPAGQRLLLLEKIFHKQGRKITLGVAEDLTPLRQSLDEFQFSFGLLELAGLLSLLAIQGAIVRRTVGRLEPVREEIQQLAQGTRTSLSEQVPREIQPLVTEFNHLLALMVQRLERSRNALGNLAHALKGPLNILTQHLDRGTDSTREDRQLARLQAERIHQLMERELRRARLAGSGVSAQRFDPQREMRDLLDLLGQVHRHKTLTTRLQIESGMPAFADREDMLELLGNLLDNAFKWAESRVNCSFDGGEIIRLRVENDGPGLSDAELERLATRGTRLDESVEGHGLGLAITKDIVGLYGGSIAFDRSPALGGLRVAVELPRSIER